MSRLTPLEEECQDILAILLDKMAAGHGKTSHLDHMELTNRVRLCLGHLTNKEFGCDSGKHAMACDCKRGAS